LSESSFDLRGLAVFRFVAGVLLVVYVLERMGGGRLVAFHTDLGLLPSGLVLAHPGGGELWSFLFGVRTPLQMRLVVGAMVLVFASLAVGFHTRTSAVLTLLSLVSLHHRNPLATNAAHVLMNVAAVWVVLLPVGEVWSIDAWLTSRHREGSSPGPVRRSRVVTFAAWGFRLHLFYVYFLNFIHKDGASWADGQAFHRVIWQNWSATAFGIFIRDYEPAWLSPLLTASVLAVEVALAVLIISPVFGRICRGLAAFLIVFLHCSIDLFNDLGIFVPVLPALALLLLAANEWGGFESRVLALADRHAPRLASFLRATGPTSIEMGERAVTASPPIRAVRALGVGARETWYVFLAVVVAWNVWDVNPYPERWFGEVTAPAFSRVTTDLLDLPGGWRMFAPDAPQHDMRIVVDAVLPDGRHIDPLTGAPPDFDVLRHGPWGLHTLWMTYEYQLCGRNQRLLWVALMGYLRRIPEIESWRGPRRFESVEIWVASIRRPDYGEPATPRRLALAARWPSGAEGAEPKEEASPELETLRPPDGMAR
jgi:hypothetical protein